MSTPTIFNKKNNIYRISIDLSGTSRKKVIEQFKNKYPELFGILSSDKPLRKQFEVNRN